MDAVWQGRSWDVAGNGSWVWDQSTGRGNFGGKCGARHCNQWGVCGVAVWKCVAWMWHSRGGVTGRLQWALQQWGVEMCHNARWLWTCSLRPLLSAMPTPMARPSATLAQQNLLRCDRNQSAVYWMRMHISAIWQVWSNNCGWICHHEWRWGLFLNYFWQSCCYVTIISLMNSHFKSIFMPECHH